MLHSEVILIKSLTQVSENAPKIISIGSRITEKQPLKKLKILFFLALIYFFLALKFFFFFVKYFGKGLLFLKIRHIRVKYGWNYGPSNLLFRFFHYSLGHLDKRQAKIVENSTIHFFESYHQESFCWKFQGLWHTHHKITIF